MANEERSKLEGTTHCRCGVKWGLHGRELEVKLKYECVACGKQIGVTKCKMFIPNQCIERYNEKGNYCDACNFKASQHIHSSSFMDLFKNKPK